MPVSRQLRSLAALALVALIPGVGAAQPQAVTRLADLDSAGRILVERPCKSPVRITSKAVRNRHDLDVRDELRLVQCSGLQAETHISGRPVLQRVVPVALKVTVPHPALPAGLQVGSPKANLSALGEPSTVRRRLVIYALPSESANDTITFATARGKIVSIEWNWDVD